MNRGRSSIWERGLSLACLVAGVLLLVAGFGPPAALAQLPTYGVGRPPAVEEVKALAAKYGKTLPQFALRWTLSQPAVHTGLVGFRRPAEVAENLGALDFTISAEDMAAIDMIFTRNDVVTEPPG